MSLRSVTGLLLVGLLLMAGCSVGPPPGPRPPSDEVNALIRLGQERLAQARYLSAGDAFRAALKQSPRGELLGLTLMGLARADAGAGEKQRAIEHLDRLLQDAPMSSPVVEAALTYAELQRDLGMCPEAVARLRPLLANPPRPLLASEQNRALDLLVACLSATRQPQAALESLKELLKLAGDGDLGYLMGPIAELAGRVDSWALEPMLAQPMSEQKRAALTLGLALAQFREGRSQEAEATVMRLRGWDAAAPLADRIAVLRREIEQARLVNTQAVGVILPLSGQYATHGRQVLAAVELGLGLFGSRSGNPPVLYIADSKSDPREAAAAVSRLVAQRKVIAIIGPMGAATSLAAARQAQHEQVPIITLSQVEGVTDAGEFAFQNFFTPDEQVQALLAEFIDRRGLNRLAILAPNTEYGRGFADRFRQGVEARGARVVEEVTYQPDQTDFTVQIKKLAHLPPGNYKPGLPDSPKAEINFQALFMPEGPERVAMLAPNLAYFDVINLWLLGTNLWHSSRLWDLAGRYLQWAAFPDAFNPDSSDPDTSRFVSEFQQAMGRQPNVLDAHGFDAARLVHHFLGGPEPPRTRGELRQALSSVSGLPGVCGLMTMGPDRRVRKALTVFIRRNRMFTPLGDTVLPPPEASGQGAAERPEPTGEVIIAPAATVVR